MGFQDIISINENLIEYIIMSYTLEPGVRKLKEILFDLYGEINIEILKCKDIENFITPIVLTEDKIDKYLKKYHKRWKGRNDDNF